jgi:hypothetical protein
LDDNHVVRPLDLTWFRTPIPGNVPVIEFEDNDSIFGGFTDDEASSMDSLDVLGLRETCLFFYVVPDRSKGFFLIDTTIINSIVTPLRKLEADGCFIIDSEILFYLLERNLEFLEKFNFLNSVCQTQIEYDNGDFDTLENGEDPLETLNFYQQGSVLSEYPLHDSYLSKLNLVEFYDKLSTVLDVVPNEKCIGALHTFLYPAYRDPSFDPYMEDIRFFIQVESFNHIIRFIDDVGNSIGILSEGETGECLGIPEYYNAHFIDKANLVDTRRLFYALEYAIANPNL